MCGIWDLIVISLTIAPYNVREVRWDNIIRKQIKINIFGGKTVFVIRHNCDCLQIINLLQKFIFTLIAADVILRKRQK